MPKMKTHAGTKKRIKVSATGKFIRHRAFTAHLFGHKTQKVKRHLRKSGSVKTCDYRRIKHQIPNL